MGLHSSYGYDFKSQNILAIKWQARRESNPQPSVLETDALPIELLTYKELVNLTYKTMYHFII